MTKMQKIWTWIFGAMFVVPEALFFTFLSSVINYSNKLFLTLITPFFDSRFFINNPTIFFIVLILELVGVVGLLVIALKSGRKLSATLLGIILLWLIFISFLAYVSNSINFLT